MRDWPLSYVALVAQKICAGVAVANRLQESELFECGTAGQAAGGQARVF